MLLTSVYLFCGIGSILGAIAHQTLFIHGECHIRAPELLVFHSGLFITLLAARSFFDNTSYGPLVKALSYVAYSYVLALLGSIVLYRIFFHPLTKGGFRGPWYARVTKLWHVWAARHSKNHLVLDQLYHEYGDFVRTGPAEITVFRPEIYMVLDGPRSQCVKSEWYDLLHPFLSLVSARDKGVHAARRREWVRCFTSKALLQHEAKVLNHVEELDACIEQDARSHRPSEMRDLFYWFGFDAMGDFVFNKSFNMLNDQRWHHIIVRLQRALSLLGPLSPAPWLIQIGLRLGPRLWVLRDWHDSVAWSKSQMRRRLDEGWAKQTVPDLTHYLMEQGEQNATKEALFWLHGDSLLAIVAGSEPTAYVLIGMFCELAKHPHHADHIFDEVQDVDVTDLKTLSRLSHLNAVINESLRLYPVLLTGGARKTTEEGITVGGTYIPPHTTIVSPRYSISRREDCFERAGEFLPERWTTRPEMIHNMAAFNPFSIGHHSCLGRQLAIDTMRYVTARLVKKYTFQLAPGETGARVFDDMADQFTANPGRLSLHFELR